MSNSIPSLRLRAWLLAWLIVGASVTPAVGADAARSTPEQVDFFERKVRPVLAQHCFQCHSASAKRVRAGLLLDSRTAMLEGGDSGPAVVPGDPQASLLVKAVHYRDYEMPPDGKLPDRVIADLEKWIADGAVYPGGAEVAKATPDPDKTHAGRDFWAFRRPEKHAPPAVRDGAWPRQPMDYFVLARLEREGLKPAGEADRRTLLRRVTFDLTGLPPTPEEMAAFLNDQSPDAYERVVARLLASPHYGERWARPWLDVARYAEDQAHIVGDNKELFYPNAYLYRDWVIGALNADVPYDRFVRLQLAADLMGKEGQADLAALGFLGLGPKYYGRGSLAVQADEWEDRVDVVGRGLLGLTVACARCHDHKYDPIPTADYYALAGVFASTRMYNRPLDAGPGLVAGKDAKDPGEAMHIICEGEPKDLNVFLRGNVQNKGPVARRHFLTVLSDDGEPEPFARGSGRLELAGEVASRDNPLTARVIVNRVWGQYFGRPLVGTPSNFGALGERPSHPELLDDLAVRFMENGWSLKWLHREIVLSAAYRQSSLAGDDVRRADPANRLLGRMGRRRLPVEMWRDAVLAAAGTLRSEVGGKSIDPQDPKEGRRTVYSAVSRFDLNPMLAAFDFPDPNAHSDGRAETITPLQKMFVLNSPWMAAQAGSLADRLRREAPDTGADADRARVGRAYELLYGRPPADAEVRLALAFVGRAADADAAWRQYCHVLLAANEMLYLD